ncbi:MAG: hypothetical protein IH950_05715 [Bacteroidetes bacterium]|nr:hypothetical protein [Bacteroidota bacterium]MCH8033241.1 hypothetical protein [Bacteroidota bacterium]
MKILMNAVNNYTLQSLNKIDNRNKIKNELAGALSKDEKNFFAEVYPKNRSEIMDYHYYNNTGKMSGVSVGSNIDRRG